MVKLAEQSNTSFKDAVNEAVARFNASNGTKEAAGQELSMLNRLYPEEMKGYVELVRTTPFPEILKKVEQDVKAPAPESKAAIAEISTPLGSSNNVNIKRSTEERPLKATDTPEDIKKKFAVDVRAGWKATSVLEYSNFFATKDGILTVEEFAKNQAGLDLAMEFRRENAKRKEQGQPPMDTENKKGMMEKHASEKDSIAKAEAELAKINKRLPDGDKDDLTWNLEGAAAEFVKSLKEKYGEQFMQDYMPRPGSKESKNPIDIVNYIENKVKARE